MGAMELTGLETETNEPRSRVYLVQGKAGGESSVLMLLCISMRQAMYRMHEPKIYSVFGLP